jgi:hypothetical protein
VASGTRGQGISTTQQAAEKRSLNGELKAENLDGIILAGIFHSQFSVVSSGCVFQQPFTEP